MTVRLVTGDRQNIASGSPWEARFSYSRAVRVGNMIFVSGTVGRDAEGNVGDGAYEQTRIALETISAALTEAGADLSHVVRTRIYLTDINDMAEVARAHSEVFAAVLPAASLVEVTRLVTPEYVVEIEADAVI